MDSLTVAAGQVGATLAAAIRSHLTRQSWTQVRRLIANRRAKVNGELCLDPARRLKEGDVVELLDRPEPIPEARRIELTIRFLDTHVVVVEKPSGISTVRHPAERAWTERRRSLMPTLDDRLQFAIATRLKQPRATLPRLRVVQRLDKETSGLVVFARSPLAEVELGRQFRRHTVIRRYLALVAGEVLPQTVRSFLARDRGDGRRGSTNIPSLGKEAVTHIDVAERLPGYTVLSCRLETGRTHQIRIHLAELGHPVCGDPVYHVRRDGSVIPDESGAPRLVLHAVELGVRHPASGNELHWEMPLPDDLRQFVDEIRDSPQTHKGHKKDKTK
jgi:23S rRNA pseudouridine1911/1915/1917 synthase